MSESPSSSPKPLPISCPPRCFGLRQQLLTVAHASTQMGAASLRNGGAIAALAFTNAVLLTSGTDAQTPPPAKNTEGEVEMPEVVVRGVEESYKVENSANTRFTAPLLNTAQTVTVIPKKLIEEQGATSLRDVLRNVPGISMQAGEGGVPSGDNLSIRGFNARTDLFIDGVRDVGGYARDPFNIEQVEVVKGPASAYSGRGSTGGSINMITKAPTAQPFFSGASGLGSANYKRETLDLNQPLKTTIPSAIRLNALYTESGVAGRDVTRNSRWGVAPSFVLGLGTPTSLTLSYLHLSENNIPDYGIPWVPVTNVPLAQFRNQPAPVDFSNYYGLTGRDYEKIQSDLLTAEFKHTLSDSTNVRFLSRYGRTYRDSIITAPRFNSAATTVILRELKSRDQENSIFSNQAETNSKFNTWGAGHTLLAGLQLDIENGKNYDRAGPAAPLADLLHPDSATPYVGTITRTGAVNKVSATSLAGYVFDTVKLSEKWQLAAGLRLERSEVTLDSRSTTGLSTPLSRTNQNASWRTSLVYKPTPSGSIYAATGTSFNSSIDGLTLTSATAAAAATQAKLLALAPERSQTFEVGTKWDFAQERLGFSAAVFRSEKTNARTPGLPGDPPTVLGGKQQVQGFELGLTGRITRGWQVFGGYTYLASEVVKSNTKTDIGHRLPNTPEQSFSLWSTIDLPWNLQLGNGVRYVDSRFSAADNLRNAPGYYVFDSSITYKATKNIDVRLNVYNIADQRYIDSIGGGHFIPGAGRSGMLTVSFKF